MTYSRSTHLKPTAYFRAVHTLPWHVLTREATGREPGANPVTQSRAPKPGCTRAVVHGVRHCELRHRPASHESSALWARQNVLQRKAPMGLISSPLAGQTWCCPSPGAVQRRGGAQCPPPAPSPAPQSLGSSTITINVLIKMHYLPKL